MWHKSQEDGPICSRLPQTCLFVPSRQPLLLQDTEEFLWEGNLHKSNAWIHPVPLQNVLWDPHQVQHHNVPGMPSGSTNTPRLPPDPGGRTAAVQGISTAPQLSFLKHNTGSKVLTTAKFWQQLAKKKPIFPLPPLCLLTFTHGFSRNIHMNIHNINTHINTDAPAQIDTVSQNILNALPDGFKIQNEGFN